MAAYKERKIIVVDSCQGCPFQGECKPWKSLSRNQKAKLVIGNSVPTKFILNGCPLPYGEDNTKAFEGI